MSLPTFNGAAGEDAQEFLDNLEITCLVTGRDDDATRLRVFPLLMKAEAKVKVEKEKKGKSLPKDKGKAKVEDVDAMPIKRARQEEEAMIETGERRKSKENGENSSKKKSKPRRKLTIKDFALGESSQSYNLVDDVSVQGPKITWPQLLHLAPKVRRQWTKINIRTSLSTEVQIDVSSDPTPCGHLHRRQSSSFGSIGPQTPIGGVPLLEALAPGLKFFRL
ncbi:hypothetical protein L7F22_000628 [Adiantum nelumboides]|nr:hypothetical protein [Adiantum nelumboides]